MAKERIPSVEESLVEPTDQKPHTFINKNLVIGIGGIFVAGLAITLIPAAIESDRQAITQDNRTAQELAAHSQLDREQTASLAAELNEQRAEVERERERIAREEEARRRAMEAAARAAGEMIPGVPVQMGGPQAPQRDPRAEQEAARLEAIRASGLVALNGSARPAGFDRSGDPSQEGFERGKTAGNPAMDMRQQVFDLLAKQQQVTGGAGGAAASPRADEATGAAAYGAWLEEYSKNSGTKPPLTQDQPVTRPIVLQGAVIPAVLVTEIQSDLPGQITAQVSMDVWDSHSQQLLIPKGSRLIGAYQNEIQTGQQRVLAAFQRLVRPDGTSIDLEGMNGADVMGRSGIEDQVDNHFWRMFGTSLLIAAVSSLAEQGQTTVVVGGSSESSDAASTTGKILSDISKRILDRNTNMRPTLTIRKGHKFNVVVTRDIALPPVPRADRW